MSKKISELPQYQGNPQPVGSIPISIGNVTYKIDPSLLITPVIPPTLPSDTLVVLNANDIKQILKINNVEVNGGIIDYVLTEDDKSSRTGTIKFSTSTNGKFSFYEDILNSLGQTGAYTFSMANDGTITTFSVYSAINKIATIIFAKKLMTNPNQ